MLSSRVFEKFYSIQMMENTEKPFQSLISALESQTNNKRFLDVPE